MAAAEAVAAGVVVAVAAITAVVVTVASAAVLPAAANEWKTRNILFRHTSATLTFFALSINCCGCPIIVSRSAKKSQL